MSEPRHYDGAPVNEPTDAPETCPLCHGELDENGDCLVHGNLAEAVEQDRAEQRLNRLIEKEDL